MYVPLETGSSSLWRESCRQFFFSLIEKPIVKLLHSVWIGGLKYLKLLIETSRLNFINLNAYKFCQPAILASKQCSLLTVSRGVSVKRGPDTCGWENADGKMRKDGKTSKKNKTRNKQTMERNLSSVCRVVGPFMFSTRCQQLARVTQGFSLNSLNPVIPFINVTETRTLRSYSLKPRMLWCTSPLSTQPGYTVCCPVSGHLKQNLSIRDALFSSR